jgi:DNA polymerase-3 subunit beta
MNRDFFKKQLMITSKAIESKTTMPILTGVKIELNNSELVLTGSNIDISIITGTEIKSKEADITTFEKGGIILNANLLLKIISALPEETFEFEVEDNHLVHITSGLADYHLNGHDVDNFPRLPEIISETPLEISSKVFKQLIDETVFAVSKQESKPILTGVHMTYDGKELTAVSTDSHRLSQRSISIELSKDESQELDIIIPGKSLLNISSIFGEEDQEIEIHLTSTQVLFIANGIFYYSRLLEGSYPDTSRLIPQTSDTKITFYTQDILKAINRASLMSHEGHNNIVKLDISKEKVLLSGNSQEIGKFDETLKVADVHGNDLSISFNPDYMKDALKVFGSSMVEIEFTSAIRPFTLRPVEEEEKFIQLITPVRTA